MKTQLDCNPRGLDLGTPGLNNGKWILKPPVSQITDAGNRWLLALNMNKIVNNKNRHIYSPDMSLTDQQLLFLSLLLFSVLTKNWTDRIVK